MVVVGLLVFDLGWWLFEVSRLGGHPLLSLCSRAPFALRKGRSSSQTRPCYPRPFLIPRDLCSNQDAKGGKGLVGVVGHVGLELCPSRPLALPFASRKGRVGR